MKIAVCFSGGIRYPHIGLESLKKIIPNNDIKIFIHTWKIENREDYLSTVADLQYKERDNTVIFDYECLEKYNYESLLIERYDDKKDLFQKKLDSLNFSSYFRTDVGPISMHYSIFKSNQLKKDYEESHGMIFDRVIRMRFDSDFEGKELNLNQLSDEINIPEGEDWCEGINDQFALGTSSGMDIYSDFYTNISKVQDVQYHPETMMRKYFEINDIKVNRFDFLVTINNKIDFRRVMFGE
jgi:hypothetical protein